jgi:16S rRNA (guanine527-N7)-methyltransferase
MMARVEFNAAARQRLLVVTGMLLEALYEPAAATVLATVKPADMRPGGARVPGTSYELEAAQATRVMHELLALRGGRADRLFEALAAADIAARYAVLAGQDPPRVSLLYPECTGETAAQGSEALEPALKRLYVAADRIFTLTQMRGIDVLRMETEPGFAGCDAAAEVRGPLGTQHAVSDFAVRLREGAAALGMALTDAQLQQFERLVAELLKWNRAYNLTAIDKPDAILTHHVLDSLAAQPELAGTTVADVGTGAGFPGLPLAIVNPARRFTLLDAVDKKLRFIDHVARELGLTNVRTRHGRAEQYAGEPFDTVIARAFAPLPRLVAWVAPLAGAGTRVVAMKGRWPPPESADRDADGGPLPPDWHIEAVRPAAVPGLAEARHLILLRRTGAP